MHWLLLSGAIAFEVAGTISLKLSNGFTKPLFIAATVIGYAVSFSFLGFALKGLPVSTVYAIWAGVGTALVAIVGIFGMGENVNTLKVVSIALVVIGVVGLHLAERAA